MKTRLATAVENRSKKAHLRSHCFEIQYIVITS